MNDSPTRDRRLLRLRLSTLAAFIIVAFLTALLLALLSPRLFGPLIAGLLLGGVLVTVVAALPSSWQPLAAALAAVAVVVLVTATTLLGVAPWAQSPTAQVLLEMGRDPAEVSAIEERMGRYQLPPAPEAVERAFGTDLPMGCAGPVCRRSGDRPFILEVPYRARVSLDAGAGSWVINEEFILDKDAVADIAHLLAVYQKEAAPPAEPEPIAEYVARGLGEGWSFDRIEEAGPVLVQSRQHRLPPMRSWSYPGEIPLASATVPLNTMRQVVLEHEDKSPVVLRLPRFLVLHSFPAGPPAALPGSPTEERRLFVPEDLDTVGLILAPQWARNTLLTHVVGLHLDGVVAGLVAIVGAAITALFKDRLSALLKAAWGWLRTRPPRESGRDTGSAPGG